MKRNLELNPRQGIAKEQSYKWDTIGVKGTGDINMILTLLKNLLSGLQIWDDWLQLGETSLCKTFSSVYLAEAVVRAGPYISLAGKVFYSEESSKVFELLYPTKRSRAFL